MKCQITKSIKKHLEYLGYTVEDHSNPNETSDEILGTHLRRSNIIVHINEQEIIYVKAYFRGLSGLRYSDIINELNETNKTTVLTKWRALKEEDKEGDRLNLSAAACKIGYDKNKFANFLDLFETEIRDHMPAFQPFTEKNNQILLPQFTNR